MHEPLYRIEELEEATGVSVRNIRYYTAEGLLPPPDARGRFALYSEDHVRRLRLIQQLKENFLPLEVIKARLGELTEPQIAALSDRRMPSETSGSAASYIAGVMAKRGRAASPVEAMPPPPMAMPAPAPAETTPPGDALAAADVWHRILLAPGIELHVRHVDDRVRQLIAFARTLFRSGS